MKVGENSAAVDGTACFRVKYWADEGSVRLSVMADLSSIDFPPASRPGVVNIKAVGGNN